MGLEMNLGYSDNATYGLDTLALGLSNANGSPQIESQVVAAFATDHYYIGLFGLGHQGVNFSEYSTPNTTFLTTLKEQNMIPSLSWGYTAGAIYRECNFSRSSHWRPRDYVRGLTHHCRHISIHTVLL